MFTDSETMGPQAATHSNPRSSQAKPGTGKSPVEDGGLSVIDVIRERGFRQFVEDLQKEKMEELRKKILESMGLTEEDLSKMLAEQRALVEEAVAREIKQRLAAQSAGNEDQGPQIPGGDLAAQVLSTSGDKGLDLGLLQVLQDRELRDDPPSGR